MKNQYKFNREETDYVIDRIGCGIVMIVILIAIAIAITTLKYN